MYHKQNRAAHGLTLEVSIHYRLIYINTGNSLQSLNTFKLLKRLLKLTLL